MQVFSALWQAFECHDALYLRFHEWGRAGHRSHTRARGIGFLSNCAGHSSFVGRAGYGVDPSDQHADLCIASTGSIRCSPCLRTSNGSNWTDLHSIGGRRGRARPSHCAAGIRFSVARHCRPAENALRVCRLCRIFKRDDRVALWGEPARSPDEELGGTVSVLCRGACTLDHGLWPYRRRCRAGCQLRGWSAVAKYGYQVPHGDGGECHVLVCWKVFYPCRGPCRAHSPPVRGYHDPASNLGAGLYLPRRPWTLWLVSLVDGGDTIESSLGVSLTDANDDDAGCER